MDFDCNAFERADEERNHQFADDFSNFMKKVEQVSDIMKGLTSPDCRIADRACEKADIFLHGKRFDRDINEEEIYTRANRTVINQKAFEEDRTQRDGPERMSKEEFMASVEEDCKRRSEERRIDQAESDRHKIEGNKAFREGNYVKALMSYNKAIEHLKDSCVLHTNRALTHIKLGLPSKALEDVDWALRINENSTKALVYKAHALFLMGKVDESNEVIETNCKLKPEQADFFREVQQKWIEESETDLS